MREACLPGWAERGTQPMLTCALQFRGWDLFSSMRSNGFGNHCGALDHSGEVINW